MEFALLDALRDIRGYIASALVEVSTGRLLGTHGDQAYLATAARGNAEIVRAIRSMMDRLQVDDLLEDILVSLDREMHLIRPLESNHGLFLYLVLDRKLTNLALARRQLRAVDLELDFG